MTNLLAHVRWIAGGTGAGKSSVTRLLAELARDDLWDAEVRRQAAEFSLPVRDIDGTRGVDSLADDLATQFLLAPG